MTHLDKLNECFDKMVGIAEEQTTKNRRYLKALLICHDALGTIALNNGVVDPRLIATEAVNQMLGALKEEEKAK